MCTVAPSTFKDPVSTTRALLIRFTVARHIARIAVATVAHACQAPSSMLVDRFDIICRPPSALATTFVEIASTVVELVTVIGDTTAPILWGYVGTSHDTRDIVHIDTVDFGSDSMFFPEVFTFLGITRVTSVSVLFPVARKMVAKLVALGDGTRVFVCPLVEFNACVPPSVEDLVADFMVGGYPPGGAERAADFLAEFRAVRGGRRKGADEQSKAGHRQW